jgi:hypothetical protein
MAVTFWSPAGFTFFLAVTGLCLFFQVASSMGFRLPVRRAPILDRIDDAVGRATEMGGEVVGCTGTRQLHSARGLHAVLAFDVCRYMAERCMKLDTPMTVYCGSGDHVPVAEDLMRTTAIAVGKPEAYAGPGTMVEYAEGFYASDEFLRSMLWSGQYKAMVDMGGSGAWASPATGMEARAADCTSIGGTSDIHSSGLYVACFDYAAIGDECWALSAYLTRDPRQLGTLMGLDFAKLIIVAVIVWGVASISLGAGAPFAA